MVVSYILSGFHSYCTIRESAIGQWKLFWRPTQYAKAICSFLDLM